MERPTNGPPLDGLALGHGRHPTRGGFPRRSHQCAGHGCDGWRSGLDGRAIDEGWRIDCGGDRKQRLDACQGDLGFWFIHGCGPSSKAPRVGEPGGYERNIGAGHKYGRFHASGPLRRMVCRGLGFAAHSVGYAGKAFGAQNFYTANFPLQYEETQTFQGQALFQKTMGDAHFEAAAYHRSHTDLFQLFREGDDFFQQTEDGFYVMTGDTAASWYAGPNQHISHTTGARARWSLRSSLGETFVSVDSRREFVKSNVLGVDSLGDESGVYVRADLRQNTDVALGHRATLGAFALAATAAWNHNTMFGARFVPGAELSIDLRGDGSAILFSSRHRSVRHPSFTDLYYTVGGAVGSRDLASEWSDHLEAGFRWNLTPKAAYALQLEQAVFQREGNDLIDWVRENGSDITQAVNLREVTFKGLESVLSIAPNKGPTGEWKLRYARLGFTTMEASESSAGFESNYVLDGIQTKVDASVGLEGPASFRLDSRFSYQDRMGRVRGPRGWRSRVRSVFIGVLHLEQGLSHGRI